MKNTAYKPLTATPYKQNETYQERQPSNPELAKYICCFWGSTHPYLKRKEHDALELVIPDTCVDIIYNIDHTDNTIAGGFCGINDVAFMSGNDRTCGHLVSTFAIRFYAWGVYPFAEDSLYGTVNGFYDVRSRFTWLDRVLRQQLFDKYSLEERSRGAEEMFLARMSAAETGSTTECVPIGGMSTVVRVRENSIVERAVAQILLCNGVLNVVQLAQECFVSSRQLERIFHEYIGMTPKKFCNLVRYQCLWGEIIRNPVFQAADAVYRYGYADQSHMLREFKRYHSMDIRRARVRACENVGNIQYNCSDGRYHI